MILDQHKIGDKNHSRIRNSAEILTIVKHAASQSPSAGTDAVLETRSMSLFRGESGSGFPLPSHRIAFPSDPAFFMALGLQAQKIRCDEDRILFDQGDGPIGLYLVRSGTVEAIVHSEDGGIAAIFCAESGAVLGLPAVASGRPYSLSALARQGSDIAFLGKEDFNELMRGHPEMYMDVLRVLAAEVQVAREALASA